MTGFAKPTAAPDRDLAAASLRGDRHAFGELVVRYRDSVTGLLYRIYGDPQLAEDAAQEAFIRAWQRLDTYKTDHPFRSWIYRIATNAALDLLRRERQTSSVEDLKLEDNQPGPEADYETKERAELVRQAVLALPENSRVVLVLREYEALSYQEIASVLNIPLGTVMSRLNYARTQLRQTLASCMENV